MKEDWLDRLYRGLWSRLGGRPWTDIMCDSQRRRPLLWLLLAGGAGILLGHLFW